MTRSAQKTLRLRLRPAAESIVRAGHPWIFADSIKEQNREGKAGELAVVFDRNNAFLAVGLYEPDSPIRVRVLHAGKPMKIDAAFWRARFERALELRAKLFPADSGTNGYRCINGENDGFPGLVMDRYAETMVIKIYTAPWLSLISEILPLVPKAFRVVVRKSRNLGGGAEVVRGEKLDGSVIFLENGYRFESDVLKGQKTGFFLDQRENRQMVGGLARGRNVLNAFSFSGGFSVYAAKGGARSVTDLDISAHALESARRNFALNALGDHECVQADTFEWLAAKPAQKFGLIVLDPPSLAKRESEKAGALAAYRRLVEMALPWLAKDGILVAASCSAHVKPDEFFAVVNEAAERADLREFKRTESPPDHPATFPEARYLKCVYFR